MAIQGHAQDDICLKVRIRQMDLLARQQSIKRCSDKVDRFWYDPARHGFILASVCTRAVETYLSYEGAQKEARGNVGYLPNAAVSEILPHQKQCRGDHGMRKVASGPYPTNQSQYNQLWSSRKGLGFRIGGTSGQPSLQILLHQGKLAHKLTSGGNRIQLDQSNQVRHKCGQESESG
jgi:hypothetical protein